MNESAGGPNQTRGYHHGDLAQALIEAALSVLSERGPAGLSLREVARRAGVSHGAPAHHFGDKAGLLTAVAVQGHRLFAAGLSRAGAGVTGDPVAAFKQTGHAYVRFAVDHRAYFELMFRPEHLNFGDPDLVEAASQSYAVLVEHVRAAQAQGLAPDSPLEDVALRAWALVHGLATLWLDGNLSALVSLSLDEVIERVLT